MEQVLTKKSYEGFVDDLKQILIEGKKRAQQAVGRQLVQTYWELGSRIAKEGLTHQAGYNKSILEDAAESLSMEYSTLTRALVFFQTYPKIAPRRNYLTWSHYQELLPLATDEKRSWYEALAERDGLNRDELRRAIRRGAYEEAGHGAKTKKAPLPLKRPAGVDYVYKAVCERVIDGDTLLLRIDLGFTVWKEQRVRLNHLDAAEKETEAGREAFEFVRNQLAQAQSLCVKTKKIDIYGRYLGDVFYAQKPQSFAKTFQEGKWLNGEIIRRGMARRV